MMSDSTGYATPVHVFPSADSNPFQLLFEFLKDTPDIQEDGLIRAEAVQDCLSRLDTAWPAEYNTDAPVLPVRTPQQLQRLMLYHVSAGFREQHLVFDQQPVVSEEPASMQRSPSGTSSAGNGSSASSSSSSASPLSSPPLKRRRGERAEVANDEEECAPSLKDQLLRLQEWLDEGIINEEEWNQQRQETIATARVRRI